MTKHFDRRPFLQASRDLRDLVAIPVMAWIGFSPARKTVPAYRDLVDAPLELSAAGFTVTTTTGPEGWRIAISKEIGPDIVLELEGQARSYAAALFQIAQDYDVAIRDLQRRAERAWNAAQEVTAA